MTRPIVTTAVLLAACTSSNPDRSPPGAHGDTSGSTTDDAMHDTSGSASSASDETTSTSGDPAEESDGSGSSSSDGAMQCEGVCAAPPKVGWNGPIVVRDG